MIGERVGGRGGNGTRWRRGAALALLVAAAPAAAQDNAPDQLTEVYRAWTVACRTAPPAAGTDAPGKRSCAMQQVVNDTATKAQLLNLVVARGAAGDLEATFVAPFGLDLARGIAVQVDGGDTFTVPFKTCFQFGCVGTLALTGQRRAALEGGRELKVRLTTADASPATLDLTVSLAGLTAALKRLETLG